MYFLDIRSLKRQLQTGVRLPEDEAFLYLLSSSIIQTLFTIVPSTVNLRNTLTTIAVMAVTVFGIIHCYSQNGGARGMGFLDRFIALSWVLGLRWFLGSLFLLIPLVIFLIAARNDRGMWIADVLEVLLVLGYYLRLGSHLRQLANPQLVAP